MQGSGLISVEIVVNGKPVREYAHEGKTYIEARQGTKYGIRLRNNTHQQILAVVTVDGLNIITGKLGTPDGEGYVIPGYAAFTIPGWRIDSAKVASFEFGAKSEGYGAQMGAPDNAGVIGVAVFREKENPVFFNFSNDVLRSRAHEVERGGGGPMKKGSSGTLFSSAEAMSDSLEYSSGSVECNAAPASANTMDFDSRGIAPRRRVEAPTKAATVFGAQNDFATEDAHFERAPSPSLLLAVFYRLRHELEALGIRLNPPPQVSSPGGPNPFPGATGCQPPPGWRG